jgi:type I restriction enzyme M protein
MKKSIPSVLEIASLDYVLTLGRYVGLEDTVDDFDFKERFTSLKSEFLAQIQEESALNKRILENLEKIVL